MNRIVHISDIHHKLDLGNEQLVLRAYVDDVKRTFSASNPDLFLISGDLAYNPDLSNIYGSLYTKLFLPLSSHFGLPIERFIILPGNHDTSRTYSKSKNIEYDHLQDIRNNIDTFMSKESEYSEYSRKLSTNFFELAEAMNQKWDNPYVSLSKFNNINIISVNSSFSCSVEGSKKDEGNLALGINTIEKLFSSINASDLNILQIHHPIGHLEEQFRIRLQPLIDKYIDIFAFGHIHQARPIFETGQASPTLVMQSGALYNYRQFFKGYAVITIDEKDASKKRLQYRTYWDDRADFDIAVNVATAGTLYSPTTKREDFENLEREDEDLFAVSCLEAAEEIRRQGPFQLFAAGEYVDPLIQEVVGSIGKVAEKISDSRREISSDEICESNANFIISGVHEGGGTLLLKEISAKILERSGRDKISGVASFIKGNDIYINKNAIDTAIRQGLPENIKKGHSIETVLINSLVTLVVDDFPPTTSLLENFVLLVKELKYNCRMIILIKSDFISSAGVTIKVPSSVNFRQVHLLPLDRTRARRIVYGYPFQDSSIDKEQLVDEIVNRFRALGIPLTHVYLKIYLAVIDKSPRFSPINTSTLVERFVEGVLERSRALNIFRGEFDYDNQRSALAALAAHLVRNKISSLTFSATIAVLDQHLDEIGFSTDIGNLVENFVNSRILYRRDNHIGFTSSVFMNYFLAIRMHERDDFYNWIFENSRCLSYIGVIEIYCGLYRSEHDVLERTLKIFREYSGFVFPFAEPEKTKKLLETLPLDSEKLGEVVIAEAEAIEKYVKDRDHAASELSKAEGPITGTPAIVPDEEITSIVLRWLSSLALVSVALKNLENVPKSMKQQPLNEIIEAWGFAAAVATYGMVLFAKDRKPVRIGDLYVTVVVPENVDSEFIRNLACHVPSIIFDYMKINIGTQKLEKLLSDFEGEYLVDIFLVKSLIVDIKDRGGVEDLNDLVKKIENSQFLSRVLYIKMVNSYIRRGSFGQKLDRDNDVDRRKTIATLQANCQNLKGNDKEKFIANRVQELQKESRKKSLVERSKT